MISRSRKEILGILKKGFVSSCQPVDGGPMDCPEIVAAMGQASISGGAVALRIEGLANIKATRQKVDAPIIGIVKRDLTNTQVRITPFIKDVVAIAKAGADIIAIDATLRERPTLVSDLVKAIHDAGCLVMADCSNFDEGIACKELGVEIIGTTLSGYVAGEVPDEPDLELVKSLHCAGCFVMAEGRYNTPALAKQAIQSGASCVTIGSAITRIEHICGWFAKAVNQETKSLDEAIG